MATLTDANRSQKQRGGVWSSNRPIAASTTFKPMDVATVDSAGRCAHLLSTSTNTTTASLIAGFITTDVPTALTADTMIATELFQPLTLIRLPITGASYAYDAATVDTAAKRQAFIGKAYALTRNAAGVYSIDITDTTNVVGRIESIDESGSAMPPVNGESSTTYAGPFYAWFRINASNLQMAG